MLQQSKESVQKFFKSQKIYEMLPASGQVLILEKHLSLLDVLELTLSHSQDTAVVWDPEQQKFDSIIAHRDLLQIIIYLYNTLDPKDIQDQVVQKLSEIPIERWRQEIQDRQWLYITPHQLLYEGLGQLQQYRIHELPIVDEDSVLVTGILRMTSILKFFVDNFIETAVSFEMSINEVPIGTSANIATASEQSNILDALRIMNNNQISSLPIVDSEESVLGILCMSDIPLIIQTGLYMTPDIPILTALEQIHPYENRGLDRVQIISSEDTLRSVITKIADSGENKVLQISEGRVTRVITESDLLLFFL